MHLNDQLLRMHAKPAINQQNSCVLSSNCSSHEFEQIKTIRSNSSMNRHISVSSYDQVNLFAEDFPSTRHQEDSPLRIHVGNIPFLWTVDDLCKQFLVFGPIKDPEIVSNERGSKGFGFITFLRRSDGVNAIRVKNGSIADGRKITHRLALQTESTRRIVIAAR
ncbi:unnamed protein product [Adineta ricciae]|uniref:RRM domain-containing protein n=1 Tax=Adineta ricciae TaxID=249248 RepID=A0A815XWB8_ADIRI|nr:unnamed protein product [Adineta ricciae]